MPWRRYSETDRANRSRHSVSKLRHYSHSNSGVLSIHMKIYLAGPMRGIPEFNFPAFNKGAAMLRAEGHEVFNPAERDAKEYGAEFTQYVKDHQTSDEKDVAKFGCTIRDCLTADLHWICTQADAIALLPGWDNSKGVRAELATANALGLQVTYLVALEEGGYHWVKQ